jgi:hypothetical protein
MGSSCALTRLALTAVGGTVALACGLGDVFASTGLEPVTLTYQGPVCLPVDSTAPFTVVVEAGGHVLPQPRLGIVSSAPSVLEVTPGLDSLRGKANGQATLTIRLESSLFTDTAPTLAELLRVRQSSASC